MRFPSQPDPEGHPGAARCCTGTVPCDEAVEDRPRGDSVERRRAGGREALAHPVGEVVDDRDGAFDALGGPDQPLGVAAGRDLARERDDTVADVDLHALPSAPCTCASTSSRTSARIDPSSRRNTASRSDREMTPTTRPASSHTGNQRR